MDTLKDIVPADSRTRLEKLKDPKLWKTAYARSTYWISNSKSGLLLAFQGVCFLAVLFGISWYSIPIAIIIGGLAGIVAAERQ
jgi:hypothetical protein